MEKLLAGFGTLLGAAYALLSLLGVAPMNLAVFFILAVGVGGVNAVALVLFWSKRSAFSLESKLNALLWGSLILWYTFGVLPFSILTLTLSIEQLRWLSLLYFLGVPLMGALLLFLARILFGPLSQTLENTPGDVQPERVLQASVKYPFTIALITEVLGTLLFTIFAVLAFRIALVPFSEAVKLMGEGIVFPLFLALFYFVSTDQLLGEVRALLEKKLNASDVVPITSAASVLRRQKRTVFKKFFGVLALLTLSIIALGGFVIIQSGQTLVREMVKQNLLREIGAVREAWQSAASDEERFALVEGVDIGKHGQILLVERGGALPSTDFSRVTQAMVSSQGLGVIEDSTGDLKLVASFGEPTSGQKIIWEVFLKDFYTPLKGLADFFVLSYVLLMLLAVALLALITGLLAEPIRSLSTRVKEALESSVSLIPDTGSADELEELSHAFSSVMSQKGKTRLDFEAALTLKEKGLQEKNIQLDELHKLAVGRELKMEELKKEIEELKKKISPPA